MGRKLPHTSSGIDLRLLIETTFLSDDSNCSVNSSDQLPPPKKQKLCARKTACAISESDGEIDGEYCPKGQIPAFYVDDNCEGW